MGRQSLTPWSLTLRAPHNISVTAKKANYDWPDKADILTIVFVDTRPWKAKHSRNSVSLTCYMTDRIEIHQSQPLAWPSNLLYVMLAGCDRWISIRHVDNTKDWRKFWKRFRVCFVFQSRVSRKTVVIVLMYCLGEDSVTHAFQW